MVEESPHQAMIIALSDAHHRGLVIPCRTDAGWLWTSEEATDRAEAARRCTADACPVIEQCGAAADASAERWHVWAGVDRQARPSRPRR